MEEPEEIKFNCAFRPRGEGGSVDMELCFPFIEAGQPFFSHHLTSGEMVFVLVANRPLSDFELETIFKNVVEDI